MQFNPTKCVILTITHNTNPNLTHYTFYGQTLTHVQETKYLGLRLDSKLTFNKHIECICKRANSALAFIKRNTHFCQRRIRVDAYCTYVRPILEYAAIVWSPYTNININKLESVQRRAARYVMPRGEYTYSQMTVYCIGKSILSVTLTSYRMIYFIWNIGQTNGLCNSTLLNVSF